MNLVQAIDEAASVGGSGERVGQGRQRQPAQHPTQHQLNLRQVDQTAHQQHQDDQGQVGWARCVDGQVGCRCGPQRLRRARQQRQRQHREARAHQHGQAWRPAPDLCPQLPGRSQQHAPGCHAHGRHAQAVAVLQRQAEQHQQAGHQHAAEVVPVTWLAAPVQHQSAVLHHGGADQQHVGRVAGWAAGRPTWQVQHQAQGQQQPERSKLAFGSAPAARQCRRHRPAQGVHSKLHGHQGDEQGLVSVHGPASLSAVGACRDHPCRC